MKNINGTPFKYVILILVSLISLGFDCGGTEATVNECNGNLQFIHWIDAHARGNKPNATPFNDHCVGEDCSDAAQTLIVF